MQVQVNFTNIYDVNTQFALYLCTSLDGVFTTLYPSSAALSEGVITMDDVLRSGQYPEVSEHAAQTFYGGNFFGKIKSLFDRGLSEWNKIKSSPITKGIVDVAKMLPEVGPVVQAVAPHVGLGKKKKGRGLVGANYLNSRLHELLE